MDQESHTEQNSIRDLKLSPQCCWRFKSSKMLIYFDWQIVPRIPWPLEDEGDIFLQDTGNHNVTFQKIRIPDYTAVITYKLTNLPTFWTTVVSPISGTSSQTAWQWRWKGNISEDLNLQHNAGLHVDLPPPAFAALRIPGRSSTLTVPGCLRSVRK